EEQEVRVAAALSAGGMNRPAAELLRKAVEGGSGSSALHLRLAGALEVLDNPAGALRHYRAALTLQPDSSPARGRMTALLLALGRNGEAAEALEELVKREPENVTALLMLGRLYAGPLARPRDAAKLLLRVLDLEPHNAAAQELLAICRQAAAAEGED
ncbi:MAG: tetratricopeptide repeat protein, partial [Candidatus Brocadiae bacterium]|nr:tetratricopeptide repeat protein [Candidatus Brocadiia bacterium]